jgi:hypothetical protein
MERGGFAALLPFSPMRLHPRFEFRIASRRQVQAQLGTAP